MSGNGGGSTSDSSSGEEDGDAEWRAAIDSVAAGAGNGSHSTTSNGSTKVLNRRSTDDDDDNERSNHNPQNLKHYQIKAQKLLDDLLAKTIEIVGDPIDVLDNDPVIDDGGVRLFTNAPRGIVFDHTVKYEQPKKRPKLLPGEEIDEKSKKFKLQLQSVAVDGIDIIAAASHACQKSLTKLKAKEAAAKAAATREEQRVAELKRVRGERWLPSIAKDMQKKKRKKKKKPKTETETETTEEKKEEVIQN